MTDTLSLALVEALDEVALERLAARLAPALADLVAPRLVEDDRWMAARDAAVYLGLTVNALHKLTAARSVPFAQDAPGGKCWFLRSELDDWRRDGH